jgi:uncharacterized RDD family membrane protein YckC
VTEPHTAVVPGAIGPRILARMIDGLILAVPTIVVGAVVYRPGDHFGVGRALLGSALVGALQTAYDAYYLSKRGQTPGKRFMQLRVMDVNTGANPTAAQAVNRAIVFGVASGGWGLFSAVAQTSGADALGLLTFVLPLLLLLSVVQDPQKRGWHNQAAATMVIDTNPRHELT